MRARVVGAELARSIVKVWIESGFEPARSGLDVERVKGVRRAGNEVMSGGRPSYALPRAMRWARSRRQRGATHCPSVLHSTRPGRSGYPSRVVDYRARNGRY